MAVPIELDPRARSMWHHVQRNEQDHLLPRGPWGRGGAVANESEKKKLEMERERERGVLDGTRV